MKMTKVKYYNDYLVLCMPDGEIIPEQINMVLNNEVGVRKVATVTITLLADISEIGEPIDNRDNKEEIVKCLEEKICIANKSAVFWENLYNNEKQRNWFDKLFNL